MTKSISLNENKTSLRISSLLEFGDLLSQINKGELDGSAALWKTPEREETLVFSEPYLENRLILVGLKGTKVDYLNVADIEGKKIGLVANYAYDDSLMKANNVELV
ncbi:MAG: transporter substrate-binding domain-containing protein [Bacteroidota bacterium]